MRQLMAKLRIIRGFRVLAISAVRVRGRRISATGGTTMQEWQRIDERVRARADWAAIEARLPVVRSAAELVAMGDDRYLSQICRRVFRAGLKHALVDAKWPAFEQAFHGFDPARVILMSDEQLEAQMHNRALIRHWGKLKSVRHNALLVVTLAERYGGFGRLLAAWPTADIIGLWALLKKEGAHLGGHSGPAFLRQVGKDTFRLSDDVVAALRQQGVVERPPTAQRDLRRVQEVFNHWHAQSGLPLSHLSLLLAHSLQ